MNNIILGERQRIDYCTLTTLSNSFQGNATRISNALKPTNRPNEAVIIMGIGPVTFASGVDLFIECARQVMLDSNNGHCHFIWVGKGYDPNHDTSYSVYLEDQLKRSGLETIVSFIDNAPTKSTYKDVDILFVSSRCDFSSHINIVIEAMAYGVPVVCFDKVTIIATLLKKIGLQDICVVPYQDSYDAARKLTHLVQSLSQRETIGNQLRRVKYLTVTEQIAIKWVYSLVSNALRAWNKILRIGAPVFTKKKQPIIPDSLFDPDFYLECYPDVAAAGVDPYQHYIQYGKAEGRKVWQFNTQQIPVNPLRDTILIVSHEASRTGAPILSLNIAQQLKKNHNVIVLLLGPGDIVNTFQEAAHHMIQINRDPDVISHTITKLMTSYKIKFAIVNSIVSHEAVAALTKFFIPVILLIHEFAAYMRPYDAIPNAVFWAYRTIFSANIIRDNAISMYAKLDADQFDVIPQGRCELPSSPHVCLNVSKKLSKTFRPASWPPETIVILGAGSVEYRKGVDLFLECATRVVQTTKNTPCRFIWIGHGYKPGKDKTYSAFLQAQVKYAGLIDCFEFMDAIAEIELAYKEANILFLSSRLDPLPNVAIDAMAHGLPIVCFDNTTGIADILKENGLQEECVAPYLDINEMAKKLIRFIQSPTHHRKKIGNRLKEIACTSFSMATYINKIEAIALNGVRHLEQESFDVACVINSDLFRPDVAIHPQWKNATREEAARHFVRSWSSRMDRRKPSPGFHPGIYLEQNGGLTPDKNPFVDYLQAGRPPGPWQCKVITPSIINDENTVKPAKRVALHLHAYYLDLVKLIIERLNMNMTQPDLFISVPSEAMFKDINVITRHYLGIIADIQVIPNRGRDFGPFLTIFSQKMLENYDIVGNFHTKKSLWMNNFSFGESWFSFLLENLIGGTHPMLDVILDTLTSDPTIGLVFPDDPYIIGWSDNFDFAKKISNKLGIENIDKEHFNFPVGSMFWAKSNALKPLIKLQLDWEDYPEEPLPQDGSILHALERLIPFIAEKAGYSYAVTNIPEIRR